MFTTLVIATHNRGKLNEFQRLLQDLPLQLRSLGDYNIQHDVPETGTTYAENAILKAQGYAKLVNEWVLADDSGLEVRALGGRPGLYTARYAGEGATQAQKWALLLEELRGKEGSERTARFVCTLALANPQGDTRLFEGYCHGQIAHAPSGTYGFGYDPIFYMPTLGCCLAEIPEQEKDKLSHRGLAVAQFKEMLLESAGE